MKKLMVFFILVFIFSLSVVNGQTPRCFDNSTSNTVAGQPTEFRLRWTDPVGLSHYIFSFDDCTGSLVNDSAVVMTGIGNWSNVTKVITSTVGCTIQWKAYANDTSDNWNASQTFGFMTTDGETPQYFDNSTNSTLPGTPVEFRLRWTDNFGLSKGILSIDNCINTFVNQTWRSLSGTEDWLNDTYKINSTVGCTIKWKQYVNDTSGNWNVSETFSFVTGDTNPPQWSNLRHEPSVVTESDSVDIKVEWSDNEDLDTVIIYENSTSTWEEHVCNLVTGICSGEILNYSIIWFFGITSAVILLIIIRVKKISKFKEVLIFIPVILVIFLISMLLFREIQTNISRMLMRLSIIPLVFPPKEFTHNISASNLDEGEVVFYYSFANDTSGNNNTSDLMNFSVEIVTTTTLPTSVPTQINLYLNGSETNVYYPNQTVYKFTAVINEAGIPVNLTTNMTGWADKSDITSVTNISTISCNVNGTWYNVTGWWWGNTTYLSSSATRYAICYESTTTTTTTPTTTTITTTTRRATTTTPTTTTTRECELTGQSCSSDSDCCSGYCCDNICSDTECKEAVGFKTYHFILIIAVISAGLIGYLYFFKFRRVKVPSASERMTQEFQTLRRTTRYLKMRGYDVSECENELNLAENALKKGLKNLATSHLRRSREILRRYR